jgi:hypothetical protein
MATLLIDNELFLIASSYVTRETGWHTNSPIFKLNRDGTAFEPHHYVATVGAHDVETITTSGRHFAFFSNDKDQKSINQFSELYEWVGGIVLVVCGSIRLLVFSYMTSSRGHCLVLMSTRF